MAALNQFEAKGINTAIGIDEAGINDDRDMLQEMRMVLRAHRVPGHGRQRADRGAGVPHGDVGRRQDHVVRRHHRHARGRQGGRHGADRLGQISYPYLDQETPLLDAVMQRAKTEGVRKVMCDGEVIYADGKFTKVDRDAALKSLHDDLHKALTDDEVERRGLSKALLPHVKAFYANYIDPARHEPFYRPSSRV